MSEQSASTTEEAEFRTKLLKMVMEQVYREVKKEFTGDENANEVISRMKV